MISMEISPNLKYSEYRNILGTPGDGKSDRASPTTKTLENLKLNPVIHARLKTLTIDIT